MLLRRLRFVVEVRLPRALGGAMAFLRKPLFDPPVFLREGVVRPDVQRLRGTSRGKLGDANFIPGEHERAREWDSRLGVERRGVAVVVAREPRTGGGRALRADRPSKLRKDLHEKGAEIRLRDRAADRDGALRSELDDLDRLAAHATEGKSPCSRR